MFLALQTLSSHLRIAKEALTTVCNLAMIAVAAIILYVVMKSSGAVQSLRNLWNLTFKYVQAVTGYLLPHHVMFHRYRG